DAARRRQPRALHGPDPGRTTARAGLRGRARGRLGAAALLRAGRRRGARPLTERDPSAAGRQGAGFGRAPNPAWTRIFWACDRISAATKRCAAPGCLAFLRTQTS